MSIKSIHTVGFYTAQLLNEPSSIMVVRASKPDEYDVTIDGHWQCRIYATLAAGIQPLRGTLTVWQTADIHAAMFAPVTFQS